MTQASQTRATFQRYQSEKMIRKEVYWENNGQVVKHEPTQYGAEFNDSVVRQ
jgi:hypothetical protein